MASGFTSQIPDASSVWRSVTGLNSEGLSGRNIVPERETGEIHASTIADRRRRRCRHHNLVGQHRLRPNANTHTSPHGRTACIHLRACVHPVLRPLLWPILLRLWPVLLRSKPSGIGRQRRWSGGLLCFLIDRRVLRARETPCFSK